MAAIRDAQLAKGALNNNVTEHEHPLDEVPTLHSPPRSRKEGGAKTQFTLLGISVASDALLEEK